MTANDIANVYNCEENIMRSNITTLKRKIKKLARSKKKAEKTLLLAEPFRFQRIRQTVSRISESIEQSSKHETELEIIREMKATVSDLREELSTTTSYLTDVEIECEMMDKELMETRKVLTQNVELKKERSELKTIIRENRKKVKRLKVSNDKLRTQVKNERNTSMKQLMESEMNHDKRCEPKDAKIVSLNETIRFLQNKIDTDIENKTPQTTLEDKETFNNETVDCVKELLTAGVAVEKVSSVMMTVGKLCKTSFSTLPSPSTINNIADRGSHVTSKQLENLPKENDTCLLSDETRKHGNSFETFTTEIMYK